ncbi:MAG TPA: NB-ARC domain-containing protein [Candidatus Acidoferrales bacterium]|nr:NB-ARC domain-containing protein [Candidatus Acidoferrales bacterium]
MLGNLPTLPTRFVGHAVEVAKIAAALQRNAPVTITGPGGVGKTRTAIELARRVGDLFPDGVWFVNLALLDEGADVVPFVCHTLRDAVPLARDARSFAAAIGDRRMLLLFDSCEHVLAQTASVVATIADVAPGTRVLVTSRQALNVPGEMAHRLETLGVDDAVELLFDRARVAGTSIDERARETASAIVSRLDNIPLAIELAAPLLRTMSAAELLQHLDDRLQLLAMENRGVPSRQQTLEAVHDWSHRLLGENAQKLFRRLAIFVGGATLEGAMHVCSDEDFNEARLSEALDELVDKSLAIAEPAPGKRRYRMLESTRAYAQNRLFEAGEYDDAAHAHVRFFLLLARRYEAILEALPVEVWQQTVMPDAQNFRAALSLALDAGDVESAAAICESLHLWLWSHGAVHALDLSRRIGTILETPMEPRAEAPLRLALAALLRAADRPRALEEAKRAYELYRGLGDVAHGADALRSTSSLQNDVLGSPSAAVAEDLSRYASLMLEAGSTLRAAELLNNLGVAWAQLLDDARLADALVCFERSAGLLEARGDRERAGRVIGNSAVVAYILGDVELAIRWGRRAVSLFDETPDIVEAGHQWSNLGFHLAVGGRYDEARAALRKAIEIARDRNDRDGLAEALEIAAHFHSLAGDERIAARLLGRAEAMQPAGVARQARDAEVMDRLIESLRGSLGEREFEEECRRGGATSVDELVRQAAMV